MALKTFNLNDKLYKEFSEHCKKHGISMSKRIDNFIKKEMDKIRLISAKEAIRERISNPNKVNEVKGEVEHSFKKYC